MLASSQIINGVIFDLDGTLMHADLDFAYLREKIGCPVNKDILEFVACLPEKEQGAASKIILQHELEDAKAASWIEGAREFLQLLVDKGFPVAIVTRNCRQAATLKLSKDVVLIDILLTREDAPPKPDPSALLCVARLWEIPVEELIYIGDFVYDVQAANNAGMRSFLYAPDNKPAYAQQAHIVFQHYQHLESLFLDFTRV